MTRSPSRRMSLEVLRYCQSNHYISQGGHEYCAEEVDRMVNEKLQEMAQRREVSDVSQWVGIVKVRREPPAFKPLWNDPRFIEVN